MPPPSSPGWTASSAASSPAPARSPAGICTRWWRPGRRGWCRRVSLVGDAAVGMHPVTAHGFNLDYSAETLARQIARRARGGRVDPADARALEAYDREHRHTARWIFRGTNAIVRLFTDDRPAARLARQATLHLAERLPPVKGRWSCGQSGRCLKRKIIHAWDRMWTVPCPARTSRPDPCR